MTVAGSPVVLSIFSIVRIVHEIRINEDISLLDAPFLKLISLHSMLFRRRSDLSQIGLLVFGRHSRYRTVQGIVIGGRYKKRRTSGQEERVQSLNNPRAVDVYTTTLVLPELEGTYVENMG